MQADPTLLPKLQAEMIASTSPAPLDFAMSRDLICGNVDEALPNVELSPPFGPTTFDIEGASISTLEDVPLAALPPSLLWGNAALPMSATSYDTTSSTSLSVTLPQPSGSVAPPSLWSSSPASITHSPLFEDFTSCGTRYTPQTESARSFSTSTSFTLDEPLSALLNSPLTPPVDASFGKAKSPASAQHEAASSRFDPIGSSRYRSPSVTSSVLVREKVVPSQKAPS